MNVESGRGFSRCPSRLDRAEGCGGRGVLNGGIRQGAGNVWISFFILKAIPG